jgi:hypothetical protein
MYKPAKYGDYYYPIWADALGWGMALLSILPIPIVAAYKLITAQGSTFSEVRNHGDFKFYSRTLHQIGAPYHCARDIRMVF